MEVYIFSSPDPKYKIKFNANTADIGWVQVALTENGTYKAHISSTTPKYIWIWVGSNVGNDDARSTEVVIVATDPHNIGGSPLSIAINQEGESNE